MITLKDIVSILEPEQDFTIYYKGENIECDSDVDKSKIPYQEREVTSIWYSHINNSIMIEI